MSPLAYGAIACLVLPYAAITVADRLMQRRRKASTARFEAKFTRPAELRIERKARQS